MSSFSFDSSGLIIKDNLGHTKFSLDKRMSPILYNVTGVIEVPPVLLDPTSKYVDRTDEFVLVNNALINTNDYFILPFYTISGGVSESLNTVTSGVGSIQLREIIQPSTGIYLGSTVMTTIAEDGVLKIVCKHSLDKQFYVNVSGDSVVFVAYRIYYGRFK
jgi:hypothetical protein